LRENLHSVLAAGRDSRATQFPGIIGGTGTRALRWSDDVPVVALATAGGILLVGGAVLEVVFVSILWYGACRLKLIGKLDKFVPDDDS